MVNSYETAKSSGPLENGGIFSRNSPFKPSIKASLPWLDVRVFYVRVSKCKIDDSTPDCLTLNHIPLSPDTLLEVNGLRTSIYSDGASTLLRRDRLDKMSEEATFVCTDSIRMTGSVRFYIFNKDVLLLSGSLELHDTKGFTGESDKSGQRWNMNCEAHILSMKGNQYILPDWGSPTIEVYIAGSFLGTPVILTKTLQLGCRKKQTKKDTLHSIPEYEASEDPQHALQLTEYPDPISENEDYRNMYLEGQPFEGEDGELSWFNAGVRVGVGIGLSICVGIGLGVGLLVRAYQGTTRNFRRRLL